MAGNNEAQKEAHKIARGLLNLLSNYKNETGAIPQYAVVDGLHTAYMTGYCEGLKAGKADAASTSMTSSRFIQNVGFSSKTRNLLTRAGFKHLSELQYYSPQDILQIYGLGPKCLDEIKETMAQNGLKLRQ